MKWSLLLLVIAVGCSKRSHDNSTTISLTQSDSLSISKKKEIQDFWSIYRQATKDRIEKSWQKAVVGYSKALEINNTHEDAIYYLANMYLELKEFDKAEENWNKLVELNPASSRANYQLGKLYFNKEAANHFDLDKATWRFQKSIEINQDFLQPVLNLAQIALIEGNYTECNKKLQLVLGSDDKNIEALYLLGYLNYIQGDMENALDNYNKSKRFSLLKISTKHIKGEGDTKSGKSLERAVNQTIFSDFLMELKNESNLADKDEMQVHFNKMSNFIIQLKNL